MAPPAIPTTQIPNDMAAALMKKVNSWWSFLFRSKVTHSSCGLISAVKMVVTLLPIVGSSLHVFRWTPNVSAVTSRGRVVETLKHKQQQQQ